MQTVTLWEGPGWYADVERWAYGGSYIESARVASPQQFDKNGYMTQEFANTFPEEYNGPFYVWGWAQERGTPYFLDKEPDNDVVQWG